MNKTVTINISGIIFHIEEDAYDSLSKYLAAIKGYFSRTDGGNEIMSDIEARIAELLQEKINVSKQVILKVDVDYVKNVMGRPEDFGAEPVNDDQEKQHSHSEPKERIRRRLFRNPDEKAIGGVCSGLAAYLGIDTVWVRLAMFLLIFFGGLSLWVYIIMWLVIPQAKTTADRFAMRGEEATVNNIFQSFKEEAEDVKNRFQKNSREYSRQFYQAGANVRSGASAVIYTLFNILARLLGLFLIIVGGIMLFGYGLALFGISIINGGVDTSVADWKAAIFDTPSDYVLGIIAFIIVAGIPIFMLLYAGVKMLFRISYSNRWLNLGLGVTWLVGFIIGSYVTITTVKHFSENSKVKEVAELHGIGDTIVLKADPISIKLKELNFYNMAELETNMEHNPGGIRFGESANGRSLIGFARLDVVENMTDSLELVIYQSAKGDTKKIANDNARAVNYSYHRNGRELVFDEFYYVNPGAKFRDQELQINLKLPKGKVVYFDKSLRHLLNNADNVTNTWTENMIGRRWKMTEKGLECIDCKDLEVHDSKHKRHHGSDGDDNDEGELHNKNITIDENGIKVNGKDAEIKIDEDGIRIKTPEKDFEIKDKDNQKKTEPSQRSKESKEA